MTSEPLRTIDSPLLCCYEAFFLLAGEVGLYLRPRPLSQSARRTAPRRPISGGLAPHPPSIPQWKNSSLSTAQPLKTKPKQILKCTRQQDVPPWVSIHAQIRRKRREWDYWLRGQKRCHLPGGEAGWEGQGGEKRSGARKSRLTCSPTSGSSLSLLPAPTWKSSFTRKNRGGSKICHRRQTSKWSSRKICGHFTFGGQIRFRLCPFHRHPPLHPATPFSSDLKQLFCWDRVRFVEIKARARVTCCAGVTEITLF